MLYYYTGQLTLTYCAISSICSCTLKETMFLEQQSHTSFQNKVLTVRYKPHILHSRKVLSRDRQQQFRYKDSTCQGSYCMQILLEFIMHRTSTHILSHGSRWTTKSTEKLCLRADVLRVILRFRIQRFSQAILCIFCSDCLGSI